VKTIGSSMQDSSPEQSVAIDTVRGTVDLIGYVGGSVDFGNGTVTLPNGGMFILELITSNGQFSWANAYSDTSNSEFYAAKVDQGRGGEKIILGKGNGANFGGVTLGSGFFLLLLDKNGDYVYSQSYPLPSSSNYPNDLEIDSNNGILVVGQGQGTLNWGATGNCTAGATDFLIAYFTNVQTTTGTTGTSGSTGTSGTTGSTGSTGSTGTTGVASTGTTEANLKATSGSVGSGTVSTSNMATGQSTSSQSASTANMATTTPTVSQALATTGKPSQGSTTGEANNNSETSSSNFRAVSIPSLITIISFTVLSITEMP